MRRLVGSRLAVLVYVAVALAGQAASVASQPLKRTAPIKLEVVFPDIKDAADPRFLQRLAPAVHAYSEGRWADMTAAAREIAAQSSRPIQERAFAHLLVGCGLMQEQSFREAAKEFLAICDMPLPAADRGGYQVSALLQAGNSFYFAKEYDQAFRIATKIMRDHPNRRMGEAGPGLAQMALASAGRRREIPGVLIAAYKRAPKSGVARLSLWVLANEYAKQRKPDLARKTYEQLIREFPGSREAEQARRALRR